MTSRLTHRGPDEQGEFVGPAVALGSSRLQVIDLATGRMPIENESGTVQLVYNGEIYNYRSLQEHLRSRGHVLRTNSDTETIVHLYEDHGVQLVDRLIGMFAFALWDAKRATLFLARDRLGIKPLFYRVSGDELLFASELKALVAVAREEPSIDLEALSEYLALKYIRAPRTMYRGYFKLPPGHILSCRGREIHISPYWEYPNSQNGMLTDLDEATSLLEQQLKTAVRDRLIADVPLGAFLSGGIDSSTVVAFAAEAADERLKTFSVGFDEDSELPYARLVAQRYDTDHHELIVQPQDWQILDRLIEAFDEPFGDSSAIPTHFVSALARRHVTVALSGDGGDELFGGYNHYLYDAQWSWLDRVPVRPRRFLFGSITDLLPASAYGWNYLRALGLSREARFTQWVTQELDPSRGGLLRPEYYERLLRPGDPFGEQFKAAGDLPFPARLMYVDATTYLPDDILTKVDRMSMAHSLEARVPILDHRLVEFAARIPAAWKLRDGQTKWILKRVARRYLPTEILDRRKRGFSVPMKKWLAGEISHLLDILLSSEARSGQYLHRPTVKRLVTEHRSGRRDHASVLWRLVVLERWLGSQTAGSC